MLSECLIYSSLYVAVRAYALWDTQAARAASCDAVIIFFEMFHTSGRWSVWAVLSIPTAQSRFFPEQIYSLSVWSTSCCRVGSAWSGTCFQRWICTTVHRCRTITSQNGQLGSRWSRSWSICPTCEICSLWSTEEATPVPTAKWPLL